jgi:hypothetical protein
MRQDSNPEQGPLYLRVFLKWEGVRVLVQIKNIRNGYRNFPPASVLVSWPRNRTPLKNYNLSLKLVISNINFCFEVP